MTETLRPGIASRHLPGAVNEVVATGELPSDTPALAALERALPPEWFAFEAVGHRLDQKGWPLRNEVELALRVCERDPELAPNDRAWLSVVRAWLDGTLTEDELDAQRRAVLAIQVGSTFATPELSDEECLRVFATLCPDPSVAERTAFLEARRAPVPAAVAWLVVACAFEASLGWAAYHVHRGLASPASSRAADVIRRVVSAGGLTWTEVVELARSLVPPSRATVAVLSDPLASEWAGALSLALDLPSVAPERVEVARFPTGDGLPALLGRLSGAYDVVVVAIGVLAGNHTWMVRESSLRNLYPNVLLALAPGVPLPDGGTPDRDWILAAAPDGRPPRDALLAGIQRVLRRGPP